MRKVLYRKSNFVAIAVLVLISWLIVMLLGLPAAVGQEKKLPIYSVATDEKKLSISFDAAWGNNHTAPLLDILDQYGIKTTFFLVDFWARKYPEDVKAIGARGHEVENHSATHPDMTKLTADQINKELDITASTIKELTGVDPTLFRPPFGAYNNNLIEISESKGYKVIQWSVDSLDWKDISADEIVKRVLDNVEPGSIVLFHNNAERIEEYLPTILEGLQTREYKVVPIGELIYKENYHIDHTGKQIKD